jgi:hypothetical protein
MGHSVLPGGRAKLNAIGKATTFQTSFTVQYLLLLLLSVQFAPNTVI